MSAALAYRNPESYLHVIPTRAAAAKKEELYKRGKAMEEDNNANRQRHLTMGGSYQTDRLEQLSDHVNETRLVIAANVNKAIDTRTDEMGVMTPDAAPESAPNVVDFAKFNAELNAIAAAGANVDTAAPSIREAVAKMSAPTPATPAAAAVPTAPAPMAQQDIPSMIKPAANTNEAKGVQNEGVADTKKPTMELSATETSSDISPASVVEVKAANVFGAASEAPMPTIPAPVAETAAPTPPVAETPAPTPPVAETPAPTPPVAETPAPTPPVAETPAPTPPVAETSTPAVDTPRPTSEVNPQPEPAPEPVVTPTFAPPKDDWNLFDFMKEQGIDSPCGTCVHQFNCKSQCKGNADTPTQNQKAVDTTSAFQKRPAYTM